MLDPHSLTNNFYSFKCNFRIIIFIYLFTIAISCHSGGCPLLMVTYNILSVTSLKFLIGKTAAINNRTKVGRGEGLLQLSYAYWSSTAMEPGRHTCGMSSATVVPQRRRSSPPVHASLGSSGGCSQRRPFSH